MHRFHPRFFSFSLFFAVALAVEAAPLRVAVNVAAGDFDRDQVMVSMPLPAAMGPESIAVERNGKPVPAQATDDRQLVFVVDKLPRGSSARFEVTGEIEGQRRGPRAATPRVRTEKVGRTIEFTVGTTDATRRQLMAYQAEPGELPRANIKKVFTRGGYLHPLVTPSGRIVTDDFPTNHIHHHGVWWAWTHTGFEGRTPDFWNMGDGKGRVEFEALDGMWSGAVQGGLRARHRFVDLTSGRPQVVLNETWQVTAYAPKPGSSYWMFDLVSEQQCATGAALTLPKYHYGGIGLRGNGAWNGEGKAFFLTSDGETDRVKGNTSRGRWCDMGGLVDGARAGVAVLCHPGNFRAPQPMRLHPTEPFFCFAPQQAGDMAIKPGEKYVSRYRLVVHDGPPDRAELDRLWNDFAHPPVVTVAGR